MVKHHSRSARSVRSPRIESIASLERSAIPRAVEDHQVRRERACQVRQREVHIALGKNIG